MSFGARLLFWPLALMTLVALALDMGAWQKDLSFHGPFEAWGSGTSSYVLRNSSPVWWSAPLGDDLEHPDRSRLRLWIDGRETGPPHTLHRTIMEGHTGGFSHWGTNVLFSLPAGVENSPETVATLRLTVQPATWLTLLLIISSLVFGWAAYRRTIRSTASRHREPLTTTIVRIPYWTMVALCGAAMIGVLTFLFSSLYALAAGWALPTTALIRFSSLVQWAARHEPDFGYVLVMCAGFGAGATWLVSTPAAREAVKSDELILRRVLLWCGFPIAACAFVFSISAMWAGILRTGDLQSFSIGGLIPLNDSVVYVAAAYDQARDGLWNATASNRPLAAAFRSVIMFLAGHSIAVSLILQTCLLAGAACFAAHAVANWRGVWAAIAFFGLTYIYARTFVPTALTEPFGLFWALLSIPFFIEAWRSGAASPALIAFAMTVVALMTRTGSMFTIPALLLWLVWQFGQTKAARFKIGVASICILLGIFGFGYLLQKAFAAPGSEAEGNFAMLICGLAMGAKHHGCFHKIFPGGAFLPDAVGIADQFYALAWESFRANPGILFERLAEGAGAFIANFGRDTWQGYSNIAKPAWSGTLIAALLVPLLYLIARRAKRIECTFWFLLWASMILSASFVYLENGGRTMATVQPLIALFLATGFASQALAATSDDRFRSGLVPCGTGILLFAAALFICVPWLVHRFPTLEASTERNAAANDQAIVFGGSRMSGFLVVDDDQPLRTDVPTLSRSEFESLSRRVRIPVTTPPPFGLVYAPRLERDTSSYVLFVVPAEVIERGAVPAWRFQLTPWREAGFAVVKAEPYRVPHR